MIETERFKNDNKTLLWLVFGGVVFYVFRKDILAYFRRKEGIDAIGGGTDNPAQMALLLRNAVNPGGKILGVNVVDFDGTDTEELFRLAPLIKDYPQVASSYELQFLEPLVERLRAEMSNDDLQRFLSLIGTGTGGAPTKPGVKYSKVFARIETPLLDYADPKKILNKVRAGTEIGAYVGEKMFATVSGNMLFVHYENRVFGFAYGRGWVQKSNVTLR
jgi:hypothetical protein